MSVKQDHVHMLIQLRSDISVNKEFSHGKQQKIFGLMDFIKIIGQVNEAVIQKYIRNQ